jgi:hypothetical protein
MFSYRRKSVYHFLDYISLKKNKKFFLLSESSNNLASEFATGYLFGEILSKYGLQEDFPQFSTSKLVKFF